MNARKNAKLTGHVDAELAVVPFTRDPDDPEAFIGEEVRVGEEWDGAPVTVRFGGHISADGASSSCVLHIYSLGREVLCLTLDTADRLALEMVSQAAMGRRVQAPGAVTIAKDVA